MGFPDREGWHMTIVGPARPHLMPGPCDGDEPFGAHSSEISTAMCTERVFRIEHKRMPLCRSQVDIGHGRVVTFSRERREPHCQGYLVTRRSPIP